MSCTRYVYYARRGARIKIGVSLNPVVRTKALDCTLLGVEPGHDCNERNGQERIAHQRWAHLHIKGEWFSRGDDLLAYIATLDCPTYTPKKRKVRAA